MSDFLVSFKEEHNPKILLNLLEKIYPGSVSGQCFEFPWGSVCALQDPLGNGASRSRNGLFAAVGDLLNYSQGIADELIFAAASVRSGQLPRNSELKNNRFFRELNGAFAILLADETGPSVVTDPLASVQVYVGRARDGSIAALGTHPDLVACLADAEDEMDAVSVFEFLNAGTPCFPHTMYSRVLELASGRLHVANVAASEITIRDAVWWPFPDEFDCVPDEAELAATLREAFKAAVQDRSRLEPVAVTLSGGLDSRLVMAAVPKATQCSGFTFCDVVNREASLARKVARCYEREWVPLFRDEEYIARTAMQTVRFIGCEGDWVNAHGMGFVDNFAQYRIRTVLTGLLMNNNVKGYYAADVHRVPRLGGLLPPEYEIRPYDYPGSLNTFSAGIFQNGLLEKARARRTRFLSEHPGTKRESMAEWLDGYPFSQAPDNTGWVAERRLLPVRLPAMDRRVLEVACRIPMRVKAEGRLFFRMACQILGKGACIPDANDGVRPGSGHASRIFQRAIRKFENSGRKFLALGGLKLSPPHSWHDYQRYWRESKLLRQFIQEHGRNLEEFEGEILGCRSQDVLHSPTLSWENGFRFVQLALWKSAVREYRRALVPSVSGSLLIKN
jgi:asparagine synthetase B (glutamine-hydrolysing)